MKILITVLAFYLVLCLFIFFHQKNLIFFPKKQLLPLPENMNISEVSFLTSDQIKLHAWYLDNKADKTVLFFHGNAGNLSHRTTQLEVFNQLKLNALIFDYRSYGKSAGEIHREQDLYLDAQAALNYLLKEKQLLIENIIIWGRSLGGALAIDLAQNKNCFALIMESTFFSMDAIASQRFWFLPVKILSKFHFRSDLKIKNITTKTLIVHSKSDEIIGFKHGQKLYAQISAPKKFLEISGSHNYGFTDSLKEYLKEIKLFLKSN